MIAYIFISGQVQAFSKLPDADDYPEGTWACMVGLTTEYWVSEYNRADTPKRFWIAKSIETVPPEHRTQLLLLGVQA